MIAPDVNPLSVHVRKINRDLQRNVRERELFLDVSYRVSGWRFYKNSFRIFNREVKIIARLSKSGKKFASSV